MNIADAKKQVKEAVQAYLAKDDAGMYRIAPQQQRPLFLIGAPGIGKTAIMSQVANELEIGLVSYSMTHHTRQSALGLPFIAQREFGDEAFDVSEYTMSEIIASIYDYMQATGVDRGILFLDEINCVSETLYPSMLQFLQFKTFGCHKVPADWVIVCAGNPPEYNRSVHEFDIVTLDRLRKMEVEPDFAAWKDYARTVNVHPAIMSYLDVRHQDFYAVESTPQGKSFVTARGWNDLSEAISLYEDLGFDIDLSFVAQYLQDDEIANRFTRYLELFNKYRSDYKIDLILDGKAPEEVRTRAADAEFDERLALLSLMLDGIEDDMRRPLEREGVVVAVRDMLREAKPAIMDGRRADEVLAGLIATLNGRIKDAETFGTESAATIRRNRLAVDMLEGLLADCTQAGADAGPDAFEALQAAYQVHVDAIAPAADEARQHLDNAFAFIDELFGDDREMLVFVTELTERPAVAGFISRFGSDTYYERSASLMVDKQESTLQKMLSTLDGLLDA